MEKQRGLMGKKYILIIFSLILSAIFCLNFVASLMGGDSVNITSIQRYGNYSTSLNVSVMTSMINTSAAYGGSFNVTMICNKSGGTSGGATLALAMSAVDMIKIVTLSNGTDGNTTAGASYARLGKIVNITRADIKANESLNWNCSLYADNITDQNWSYANGPISLNLSNLTFDSTPPNVSSTLISPVSYGNYTSRTLVLNITLNDVTVGMTRGSVYFNITYSNGTQVNYSLATSNSDLLGYYVSINTTTFLDEHYNITVFANDSLNNINTSTMIYVTLDKTAPTGTITCSPRELYRGATTTCSCGGSDAIFPTVTATPASIDIVTTQTGEFASGCVINDSAGNSYSLSATYVVTLEPSNSGSGSPSTTTPSTTSTNTNTTPSTTTPSSTTSTETSNPLNSTNIGQQSGMLLGMSYWIWIIIVAAVLVTVFLVKKFLPKKKRK
jgi:hypothetical protein